MPTPILVPALLAGLLAPAAAPPPTAPLAAAGPQRRTEPADPVERLSRWVEHYAKVRPGLDAQDFATVEALVADLRMLQIAEPDRRREVLLALLDLAGLAERRRARDRRTGPDTTTLRLRAVAEPALEAMFLADRGGALRKWMASSVLMLPDVHPVDRRVAATKLLVGRHDPETQLALFTAASSDEPRLREAAMVALAGWADDDVHRFMLRQLQRARTEPGWVPPAVVQRHFERVTVDPDAAGGKALYEFASRAILDPDWRQAWRALQMLGAVPDARSVPALIEALSVWTGRREGGGGSRRIEHEILQELEERSGRRLGLHPERWARWWKVSGSGRVPDAEKAAPGERTTAAFFGLRPVTDRVVFVIDRSGSMEARFGATGNNRYEEATDQMVAYLSELGPETRFRVIVFSDDLRVWKERLQPATPGNLDRAKRWLGYQRPNGGTYLRPGIEETFRLDRSGRPDLDRLEADSVVVLCDGATTEGPAWVAPFLAAVNDDACLVIHAVQLGNGGDGTLSRLAELTGGEHVRVRE